MVSDNADLHSASENVSDSVVTVLFEELQIWSERWSIDTSFQPNYHSIEFQTQNLHKTKQRSSQIETVITIFYHNICPSWYFFTFSPCVFEFVNKIEDCLECVKVSNRLSPPAPRAAHSDYYHWDLTSENIKNKTGTDRMLSLRRDILCTTELRGIVIILTPFAN